jgi:UDP-N-acetylmuramoyl-L-alanyl-D-glutamate--2,6-diaminopimelate ligase
MNILKLRNKLNFLYEIINYDCTVSNISFDSRTVEKNYAFIAIKGTKTDGHNYIEQV